MTPDEACSRIWRSIFTVFGYFDDALQRLDAGHSQYGALSVAQTRMLRTLRTLQEEHPAGVKLKELAERLRIGPAAASEMVDVLCRKKLLCCEPCEQDRRAVSIRFADGVLDREGEIDPVFAAEAKALCSGFSDEELLLLEKLLDRMCRRGRKLSR